MKALGADSCTFYVRDPWWADDFRLLFMPGVAYVEPMHGFIFPIDTLRADEPDEVYYRDASALQRKRDSMPPARVELARRDRRFGDFVAREEVASCAQFLQRSVNNRP